MLYGRSFFPASLARIFVTSKGVLSDPRADGAKAPALAAEREQVFGVAGFATTAQEAVFEAATWELTNTGTQDVFVTRVVVTWPSAHGQVK